MRFGEIRSVLFFQQPMVLLLRRSVDVAVRLIIVGMCSWAAWHSIQLARADFLFKQDTEASVRSAIRLVPDGWEYYIRLAQFDREHSDDLLGKSLRLNSYNAGAAIAVGLQYEADGDQGHAEKLLLQAFSVDHTYLPRWSLANFYFRHDDMPQFWFWARKAAEMPSDDIDGLFELCWRVEPNADIISKQIATDKPEFLRQYAAWLLSKDQADAAAAVSARLLDVGDAELDRSLLFALVNRLSAANRANAATDLWHALIKGGWAAADSSVPNNPTFAREPLPVAFDWSLPEYSGLHSWPGPSGLETEFTGSEPEACTVVEQSIWLNPGNYTFRSAYRTSGIAQNTGLSWQIIYAQSDAILAESDDLASEKGNESVLDFTVPPGTSLIRLRLVYHRAIGTTHIEGTLMIKSTEIKVQAHT
jgi:hypothetical protein